MLVLETGRNAAVWRVEFSPDGSKLVGAHDAEPCVWTVATGHRLNLRTDGTYFWNGTHASFHPSSRWLVGTGIGKGGPLVHDFQKRKSWREPLEYRVEILRAAFMPDGKTVLYTADLGTGPRSRLVVCRPWKANGTIGLGWSNVLDADLDLHPRNDIVVLASGGRFATVHQKLDADGNRTNGGRIVIQSLKGATLATANFPTAKSNSTPQLAVAPDDSLFVAQSQDFLNVFTQIEPRPTWRHIQNDGTKHFTGVAFHPSGKYLAATSNDATVKLYDTTTWEVARAFTWHIGKMRSVTFSRDGTLAAAGSDKGKVVVWDVDL